MDKIYKSVTNVARVIVVNGKVQEVNLHLIVFVNLLQQQILGVFVGDVPDHQSRTTVNLDLHIERCTSFGMILNSWG